MASREISLDANQQLAVAISEFWGDPLGYVMFAFPWDSEKSIQLVPLPQKYRERFNCEWGPDEWACEFLEEWGRDIRTNAFDGRIAKDPLRYCTTSGHGIGKSTMVAWIVKFIMDTRPGSRGTVTANTADQLRTKTWAEVGRWHNMSITRHWFDYSSGRGSMGLYSNQINPKTGKSWRDDWKCTAQTSREENSESFAGQHAASATSFYIFDEASAIPNRIYEVREGGLTDGEPMVFDFGNPTRNSGRFYDQCTDKDLIKKLRIRVRQIDSRDVAITNKKQFNEWVEAFGEDSDFVRVRVRGMFPHASSMQFIATGDVEAAMRRETPNVLIDEPLIIGVDCAGFGDDENIIYPRIGNDARSFPCKRIREVDHIQLSGLVIEQIQFFRRLGKECAALFVDCTGGYGQGLVTHLRHLQYNPIPINFGNKPIDVASYSRRGDEMWGRLNQAIKDGLVLPDPETRAGKDLLKQLTSREYGYTLVGNKVQLETKRDMKARGLSSPDIADALALTYAMEVGPTNLQNVGVANFTQTKFDYDPYEMERY